MQHEHLGRAISDAATRLAASRSGARAGDAQVGTFLEDARFGIGRPAQVLADRASLMRSGVARPAKRSSSHHSFSSEHEQFCDALCPFDAQSGAHALLLPDRKLFARVEISAVTTDRRRARNGRRRRVRGCSPCPHPRRDSQRDPEAGLRGRHGAHLADAARHRRRRDARPGGARHGAQEDGQQDTADEEATMKDRL